MATAFILAGCAVGVVAQAQTGVPVSLVLDSRLSPLSSLPKGGNLFDEEYTAYLNRTVVSRDEDGTITAMTVRIQLPNSRGIGQMGNFDFTAQPGDTLFVGCTATYNVLIPWWFGGWMMFPVVGQKGWLIQDSFNGGVPLFYVIDVHE